VRNRIVSVGERAIAAVLAVAPRLLTTEGEFSIPTPDSNGHWRGRAANLREVDGTLVAALHCRTWLSNENLEPRD
jgi:hypothetical protein